ncbi:hypothetical protein HK097_000226, partial [Rhizophlyctis rosea]
MFSSPTQTVKKLFIYTLLSLITTQTSAQDTSNTTDPSEQQTVYLIRHAEKPHDNDVG